MKEIRLEIEELEERIAPQFIPIGLLGKGNANVQYVLNTETGEKGLLSNSGFHALPSQSEHGIMTSIG